MGRPLACRLFGCRWDFRAEGDTVTWTCARNCGGGGRHRVGGTAEAERLVRQLERGRPGPPLPLLAALSGTVHRPTDEGGHGRGRHGDRRPGSG